MPSLAVPVTRRSVLAWSGTGTLGLAIGAGRPAPSRADTPPQLSVAGFASTFATFSEDFTQRFANALPNAVELRAPVAIGGGSVRVGFDRRMLALSDGVAQWVADGDVFSTPLSVNGGTVTVSIPDRVRATRVVVALPFFTTIQYPAENVGPSIAPTARVTVGGQVADAPFSLAQPTADGIAWGGEIDVAWRPLALRSDTEYLAPGLVTLTSVGPGPVPAGTRIRVHTDSVLTGASRPVPLPTTADDTAESPSAEGSGRSDVPDLEQDPSAAAPETAVTNAEEDGARSTDITLANALGPGLTYTTALQTGDATSQVRVKSVTFARVSLQPPASALAMQRVTGAETVTSLAPGGLPLSTKMMMGSI